MSELTYRVLGLQDRDLLEQIAEWYWLEWKVPTELSSSKLKAVCADQKQFHLLLYRDQIPMATGGLHSHLRLLD